MSNRKGIGKSWDWHIIKQTKPQKQDIAGGQKEKPLFSDARDFIDLFKGIWRIEKTLKGLDIPENKKNALKSALNRIDNFLKLKKIEIKDYTGEKFNEGMNIEIIDSIKNPNIEVPIIKETLDPTIIVCGVIISKARVIKEIKAEE